MPDAATLPRPEKRKKRQPMSEQVRAGMRFGHWEIIAPDQPRNGHAHFICKCVCGKQKSIMGGHLTGGRSTNCGCKKPGKYRHGEAKTRTHRIWSQMKGRCSNANLPGFELYGGRGITVCDRWQTYENFAADMGRAPAGLTLDRIDNDGNYEPGNCRWATQAEQCRNQSKTIRFTMNGKTQALSDWADATGIDHRCLYWRYTQGWTDERILTTPSRTANTLTVDGETLSLKEWARKVGTPYQTIVTRKNKGWEPRAVLFGRAA